MMDVSLDDEEPVLLAGAPASPQTSLAGGDAQVQRGSHGGSGGLLGKVKARASETAKGVMGAQNYKAGVGFVKDASKVISDQGKEGVKIVKGKTKELAESKQVQQSLDFVKDKTKEFKELGVVKNTTKELKEFGSAVAETAENVTRRWKAGGGQVVRSPAAWRGGGGRSGARTMLGLDAPEAWRGVDIQAIEEIAIPARGMHSIAHVVTKGSRLRWVFCVKEHSVEFAVRTRAFREGDSIEEEEVLPLTKYSCGECIQGSWMADENWTVDLHFDNRSSMLRPKTLAYAVGVEPPGADAPATSSTAEAFWARSAPQDAVGFGAAVPLVQTAPAEVEQGIDLFRADQPPPPPLFAGSSPAPPAAAAVSAAATTFPLVEPPTDGQQGEADSDGDEDIFGSLLDEGGDKGGPALAGPALAYPAPAANVPAAAPAAEPAAAPVAVPAAVPAAVAPAPAAQPVAATDAPVPAPEPAVVATAEGATEPLQELAAAQEAAPAAAAPEVPAAEPAAAPAAAAMDAGFDLLGASQAPAPGAAEAAVSPLDLLAQPAAAAPAPAELLQGEPAAAPVAAQGAAPGPLDLL